tara:strand:+ start:12573 stop:12995 length:423 start_codon:yes stop_codon:yes gene_type:complete
MKRKVKKLSPYNYHEEDLEFAVLAINTHSKGYKLCWNINKKLNWDLKKIKDHTTKENTYFTRYGYETEDYEYELMANQSSSGYLLPSKKNVNFFLKITSPFCNKKKQEIAKSFQKIPEVLLVFGLELKKQEYTERFISND